MKKNLKSNLLILLGAVLILASLGLTMYNLYEDDTAGRNTPDPDGIVQAGAVSSLAGYEEYIPDYELDPDFEMPVVEVDGREYVGRLDIARLDLSLPVLSELTMANLKIAPARYSGDAYDGNCIIGAHNYNSHFGRLKDLDEGDEVLFTDMDGNQFRYEVKRTDILDGYDVDGLNAGDWDMTLFTCTRGGKNRVTVRLGLVSEQA